MTPIMYYHRRRLLIKYGFNKIPKNQINSKLLTFYQYLKLARGELRGVQKCAVNSTANILLRNLRTKVLGLIMWEI